MSAIEEMLQANATFTEGFGEPPAGRPARHVAVVTCMDCRLDLMDGLGLAVGDAHMMRNAGGLVTDDVLRSLAISQRALGTTEIMLMHHTRCGMDGFDDAGFRAGLAEETGSVPTWDVPGFTDVQEQVRASMQRVRDCAWLVHRDGVRGFVYDVDAGRVDEVR